MDFAIDDYVNYGHLVPSQVLVLLQLVIKLTNELLIKLMQPHSQLLLNLKVLVVRRVTTEHFHFETVDELARVTSHLAEEVSLDGVDSYLLPSMLEHLLSPITCLQNPLIEDKALGKYLNLFLFEHWDVACRVELLIAMLVEICLS